MKQRILIEGTVLVEGHFSGIGQYTLGILRALDIYIEEAKKENKPYPEIKVIIPFGSIKKFRSYHFQHINYLLFPFPLRIINRLWRYNLIPPIDLLYGKAIYFFPRFVSMPLLFSKSAIVIYDLSYELHREYSDKTNAEYLSRKVPSSIKRASKIITISENSKKEIASFYKVDAAKISVATPATDPDLFYPKDKKEINITKQKYGIEGKYILALSNLEPRKNLEGTLDAYRRLPRDLTKEVSLLIVGAVGWKTDSLLKKIAKYQSEGYHIIRPSSYIHDIDKPAIISGAEMLVYPSHYEGFGMPPLEALACGTPVITADNSSLPEAVGNMGVMIKSNDTEALANSMKNYLEDPSFKKRALRDGPKHAQTFSWKESAQIFLETARDLHT